MKDITGEVFHNRLTAISFIELRKGRQIWLFKCKCGNEKEISLIDIKRGDTKSCGCLRKALLSARNITHNMTGTRLYRVWKNMKQRCYNPNNIYYHNYGGRGIIMCEEWKNSYELFHIWATNNGYHKDLEIERLDNNDGYSPLNCAFVTIIQQSNNRRTNRYIEYKGKKQTISQWGRELGISVDSIRYKLNKGLPTEQVLEKDL